MLKPRLYALHTLFLLLIACLLFTACGSSTGTTSGTAATTTPKVVTLKVFAAASLTEAFKTIEKKFHAAHSTITVTFNFAGSQALVQQLKNGAPDDVFASADQTNMTNATTNGLVSDSQVFARNKLVLIAPANNSKVTSLKDLATKGIKIDVAAPTVPAGKYARQVLDKMGKSPNYGAAYESAVKGNFVSQEDNVKAVVTKVQLGEADAGFVYLTDVTAKTATQVKEITIPDDFNVVAEYPIAVTKNSQDVAAAKTFVAYVLSSEGQAILQKARFTPVSA